MTTEHQTASDISDANDPAFRDWKSVPPINYSRPEPLFDRPFEISIHKLRGLRMVDETVILYGTENDHQ